MKTGVKIFKKRRKHDPTKRKVEKIKKNYI
jgi:hypothetical protein